MIEKWEIHPAPTTRDSRRYLLLIRGEMSDVQKLIMKLGALCGRPRKAEAPFKYSLYLKELAPSVKERVENVLKSQDVLMPEPPLPVAVAIRSPQPPVQAVSRIPERAISVLPVPIPLNPRFTFQNLLVGPHNRFAHAASMSVVESPGSMYNPLLLFGAPGTGKSHFLHAVAQGLARNLPPETIVLTTGARMAAQITSTVTKEKSSQVETLFKQAKALLVDDIHLLSPSGTNQPFLAQVFNSFLNQNRQVVLTSVYPPKALGALENSLGFKLNQGWMVDMKMPTPLVQQSLVQQLLSAEGFDLAENEIQEFFIRPLMNSGDIALAIRRLRFLKTQGRLLNISDGLRKMSSAGESVSQTMLMEGELNKVKTFKLPSSSAKSWVGVFYPRGAEGEKQWMLYQLCQGAGSLGIPIGGEQVVNQEYDPNEIYGTPFLVGDSCTQRRVTMAFVLGPPANSELGNREAELFHALRHILESLEVRLGWISFSSLKSPSAYLRAVLDAVSA
ncbi:MAG: AAA family ATPase [Elusimicrobia bacterium]|nr:AAA family ATPase [Elusimicrobiota bacterium]